MLGLVRLGSHTGFGAIWWDFALAGAGVGAVLGAIIDARTSHAGQGYTDGPHVAKWVSGVALLVLAAIVAVLLRRGVTTARSDK